MNPPLHEAARERRLVADGAMGTALMAAGLEAGGCGEWWNVAHPERILEIQRRYVQAGADCLITNTFGGSRIMLARHGRGDLVREINRAAVRIAREAFGGRDGYVLGDIGPLGALLEPYGDLSEDRSPRRARGAGGGARRGGADGIIIETETSPRGDRPGDRRGEGRGRAIGHRVARLRPLDRRQLLRHDDGRPAGPGRRLHGGARGGHRGASTAGPAWT